MDFKTGEIAYIEDRGMKFEIKVMEEKTAWGKKRWLVTPAKGTGEAWVQDVIKRK